MDHIGPGPIIPSLLNLQDDHVSTTIWIGREVTFRARYNLWLQVLVEPMLQVIRNTAFGKILDIERAEINNHLILSLVERWRPEMHTFHLPIGECTVTLEDVAYQLGLPIDGDIVTRPTNMDWNVVRHNLLGAIPNERQIVGQRIQMSWLDSTFQQLPDDSTEISWAYDRIPMLAPRLNVPTTNLFSLVRRWSQHLLTTNIPGHETNIIRSMLDCLHIDQFVWTPYQNIDVVGQIPDMARSRVPLICFAIIEWHAADRVMRQFGLQQPIPQDPINLQKQHKMDLRGKNDYNWQQKHDQWIQIWNHREDYVMNGLPSVQPLYHYSHAVVPTKDKKIHYNFIRSIRDQCAPSNVHDNPMQTIHESLPSIFGTTSTTPLSAFNSQQYYQPTMLTQVDDEDVEDDDEEDEEVPQLVRGGTRQPTQPSLRVQPPRRRKPTPCGTSSHRRH
ncbi:hypothetical protein Lal_00042684 [Lupinus albus]|nr:hypothetical protein Lal_00042684 [Lupinus albus]